MTMSSVPRVGIDPFTCPVQSMSTKPVIHDTFRQAGPLIEATAPAGGPAWVVTDAELARRILADPRFVKDPELAPTSWRGVDDGLDFPEPQMRKFTLIAVDGEDHRRLRRVHGPAFNPRRLQASADRIREIATELLDELATRSAATGEPIEMINEFAFQFPLLVICDQLGVPVTDPAMVRSAITTLKAIALRTFDGADVDPSALTEILTRTVQAARSGTEDTMTRVLFERAEAEFPDLRDEDLIFMITGLIFAGHDTTGSFLGFLLAHVLAGHIPSGSDDSDISRYIEEALRVHPPVPYTLWRFASTDVEIAGTQLPRGAPVLIDIEGINTHPGTFDAPLSVRPGRVSAGQYFTFGGGVHYCLGEQLAMIEAKAMVRTILSGYPNARLAVGLDELRWGRTGSQTARLESLPAWLR